MSRTKVAIVTGANKGLGLAIVKGLCKKINVIVYLTSRDEERGRKACDELRKLNLTNFEYHQLDITNVKSIQKFCYELRSKHKQIDIVVNNAGIIFLKDSTEPKVFQAEQTVAVNFSALVIFSEAILPLIANGGSIVNVSSSSGHLSRIPSEELRNKFLSEDLSLGKLRDLMQSYLEAIRMDREVEDGWGVSPYVVSKGGVNAYTFMLHRRVIDRDISVNCVHPGYVMSDMTKGAGSVTPEEAAYHPVRLAIDPNGSGQFVWHNGTVVPWDGPDPRTFIDGL